MKQKNSKQANLLQSLLNQPDDIASLELALMTLISTDDPLTIDSVATTSGLPREGVRLLLPCYTQRKSERIELRCSWTEKKRWEHKAKLSNKTVSQLAAHSLNRLTLHIPPIEQLRKEIDLVVRERVRFNGLVNQIAKWCNTERSAIRQVEILAALDELLDQFEFHDQQVMRILQHDNGGKH